MTVTLSVVKRRLQRIDRLKARNGFLFKTNKTSTNYCIDTDLTYVRYNKKIIIVKALMVKSDRFSSASASRQC